MLLRLRGGGSFASGAGEFPKTAMLDCSRKLNIVTHERVMAAGLPD
jgi:hypothetical protein